MVVATAAAQTVRHGDDTDPSWSPDGTRIAFVSDRHSDLDLYVMDADGGNVLRLTDDSAKPNDPTWPPDGTRLAFASDRDGDRDIYVLDADGRNVRLLTDGPAPTATATPPPVSPPPVCSGGWLYCGYAEACWRGGGEVGINTANSACSHANMMKGGDGGYCGRRADGSYPTSHPCVPGRDPVTGKRLATPTPTPTGSWEAGDDVYIVQTGDTLYAIAQDLGVSVESLAEVNGNIDPSQLFVGRPLTIPERR